MLNSSRRLGTNCYYLPSLCKFYEGRVQSHVPFPSISHGSDTSKPLAAARPPAPRRESFAVPRAQRIPTRRAHRCHGPQLRNFHYRPQWWSCLPQLHLRQQKTAGPSPQHRRRHRGSFGGRILHLRPALTQVLGAEAPQLHQALVPWTEPELPLTMSGCAREHI